MTFSPDFSPNISPDVSQTVSVPTSQQLLELLPLWLRGLQWFMLSFIPLSSAHSFRRVLWEVTIPDTQIYVEFRGIVLFLMDYALILLILFTVLRLAFDVTYRTELAETARQVISQYGGFWWVGLLVWMGISGLWASTPALVVYQVVHLAGILAMAVILADFVRQRHEWEIGALLAFCAGAVFQTVLAIGQTIHKAPLGLGWLGEIQWEPGKLFNFQEQTFRAYGLAVHPNNLGGFLLISLFACLMLLYHQRRRRGWLVGLILLTALLALGWLLTISRTAILAGLITLPLAGSLVVNRKQIRRFTWLIVLVVVVVIAAVIVLANTEAGSNIITRLVFLVNNPKSVLDRIFYAFPDTTTIIQQSPLLGVGSGNLMVQIGHLPTSATGELLLPAHNSFWMVWSELGIPGLALFIVACLYVLRNVWSRRNAGPHQGVGPQQGVGEFLWGCCFLGICIIMVFDYYFWGDLRSQALLFWVLGMWWGCRAYASVYTPF